MKLCNCTGFWPVVTVIQRDSDGFIIGFCITCPTCKQKWEVEEATLLGQWQVDAGVDHFVFVQRQERTRSNTRT